MVSESVRHYELQPTRLLCPWDSPGKNTGVGCHTLLQSHTIYNYIYLGIYRVAQMVKNLPAMQETWVQSLGQEDTLEKGMAYICI